MFIFNMKRKAEQEVEARRNRSSTYTEPLQDADDMKEFVSTLKNERASVEPNIRFAKLCT
jgi:hypothetical protein